MAALARWAWATERWMSSKTRTNVRPCRASGDWFVEKGRRWAEAGGAPRAGSCTASKLVIVWGTPFSRTVKSPWVNPGTARPLASTTTASTVTISTREGNAGAPPGAIGVCWETAAGPAESSARTSKPRRVTQAFKAPG